MLLLREALTVELLTIAFEPLSPGLLATLAVTRIAEIALLLRLRSLVSIRTTEHLPVLPQLLLVGGHRRFRPQPTQAGLRRERGTLHWERYASRCLRSSRSCDKPEDPNA